MIEKESVDALAERIADEVFRVCISRHRVGLAPHAGVLYEAVRRSIPEISTVQPTEKQQPADDANYETAWLIEANFGGTPIWYDGHGWTTDAYKAQRFESKILAEYCIGKQGSQFPDAIATEHGFDSTPPQPAEPVVTEGDRELAKRLGGNVNIVATIIAKARQAEREELRQAQLTGVSQMNEIRSLKEQLANSKDETERARYEWGNWESMFGNQQKQLVASHKKIETLEARNRTLMAALYGIETCASAAVGSSEQPATADAKGGE